MTSGWLQHAACTPELLARKIAADRALPLAEALTSAIFAPFGYATVAIRPRGAIERAPSLPIEPQYLQTGLITEPRAGHGEKNGQMYLLWGVNASPRWDHDDLYRSKEQDFKCDASTFVSSVTNEAPDGLAYRIMRHEDLGLDHHARYWYRIVPVFKDGGRGEPSAPFGGITRGDESP